MIEVLVVDDEHLVRRGIVSTFPWDKFGMHVAADASSGKKALQLLGELDIDLLFVDLTMPLMSGFELIERVIAQYPHVVTVVLTCHQEFRYIQDALRLGAVDYIIKTELEKENIERILARIRQRMAADGRRGALRAADAAAEAGAARMASVAAVAPGPQEVREESGGWTALDWILSAKAFEARLAALERKRWPHTALAQVYEAVARHWNRLARPEWVIAPELGAAPGTGRGPAVVGERFPEAAAVGAWPAEPATGRSVEPATAWERFATAMCVCRKQMESRLKRSGYFQETLEAVVKSLHYIERQEQLSFTIGDVAHAVGMSVSYFSKVFKDVTGRTFSEYMKSARVERAKVWLASTQDPIYLIARKVGYEDEKYFSKTFREQVGLLPSEYRQKEDERNVSNY